MSYEIPKIRRPVREYSLRMRHQGLSSRKVKLLRRHRLLLLMLLRYYQKKRNNASKRLFYLFFGYYLNKWQETPAILRPPRPSPFLIENVDPVEARNLFRFEKPDLVRLFSLSKIPNIVRLPRSEEH